MTTHTPRSYLEQRRQERLDRHADEITALTVTAYRCPECACIHEEEPEVDPRYECPECGTEFSRSESDYDSHRSSCCNKFSSKLYATTCPECMEGVEEWDEVAAVQVGGELEPVDDLDHDHLDELFGEDEALS